MERFTYEVRKDEEVLNSSSPNLNRVPSQCYQIIFEGKETTADFTIDEIRNVTGQDYRSFAAPSENGIMTDNYKVKITAGTVIVTRIYCDNFKLAK